MKRVFSGIQPSGIIHLGNYLGAIKQWVELQDKVDESIFCIVDLHAITVRQNPKELKENILKAAATYLACGVDPKKSTIFVQSSRPEHTELMWTLNTLTSVGELNRMTQYKEKSGHLVLRREVEKIINEMVWTQETDPKEALQMYDRLISDIKDKIELKSSAGLLTYPVLMAADILLYKTNLVPVGEDQKQHLELTIHLAKTFNNRYGNVFPIPEYFAKETAKRIMGLDNPLKKMSKSAESSANYIALDDSAETIKRKIMRAVTDSGSQVIASPDKPALTNLLNIYSEVSGKSISEIEHMYEGKGYGDFKAGLAEVVIEFLSPIQEKYTKLMKDKAGLIRILEEGSKKLAPIASETISEVKSKMGLGI